LVEHKQIVAIEPTVVRCRIDRVERRPQHENNQVVSREVEDKALIIFHGNRLEHAQNQGEQRNNDNVVMFYDIMDICLIENTIIFNVHNECRDNTARHVDEDIKEEHSSVLRRDGNKDEIRSDVAKLERHSLTGQFPQRGEQLIKLQKQRKRKDQYQYVSIFHRTLFEDQGEHRNFRDHKQKPEDMHRLHKREDDVRMRVEYSLKRVHRHDRKDTKHENNRKREDILFREFPYVDIAEEYKRDRRELH